jgi:hypothetical protein
MPAERCRVATALAAASLMSACGGTTAASVEGGAPSAAVDASSDSVLGEVGSASTDSGLEDGASSVEAAADGQTLCIAATSSTLPHVRIVFGATTCVFTLAQAAATISIPYDLVVDQDVPGFTPASPYWYGSSAANLALHEVLSGGGQTYCLCDQGLPDPVCPTDDGGLTPTSGGPNGGCGPVTIPAGTYHRVFTWDGRSWMGPSDTANPQGPPFPAGDYQFAVSTTPGSIGDAGAMSATGTLGIRLVP